MKLERIVSKIKSIQVDYRQKCAFWPAPVAFVYAWSRYSTIGLDNMHQAVSRVLEPYFNKSVERNHFDLDANYILEDIDSNCPIWTIWMQGEDKMPDIVRACVNSIRKYAAGKDVILLTFDNIAEFVDIPEDIFKKIEEGKMSLTHLADLTRLFILSKYGGWWFDSTVYVTKPIIHTRSKMYTLKWNGSSRRNIGGGNNWTAYLFACGNKNPYMPVLRDSYLSYWMENDKLIEYFMIDYFINFMYERCPSFRKEIDCIPIDNPNINELYKHRFDVYSDKKWKELTGPRFNKLNWRCGVPNANTIFERIISG